MKTSETYAYLTYGNTYGLQVGGPGHRRLGVLLAVHAPSRAAARRAFAAVGTEVGDAHFRDYGQNWGPDHADAEALRAKPGVVFARLEDARDRTDWTEVPC